MQGLGFCPGVGEDQVLAATMESVSHEKEEVVWARAALSGCSGAPGSLPRCRLRGPPASGRRVQGRLCVPGPVLFWVIDLAPWLALPCKPGLAKGWGWGQLGEDASRDHQNPSCVDRLVDHWMPEPKFRPDGPLLQAWCHQCHPGLPGDTQLPSQPQPKPGLISQRRSWARGPPSLPPPPRT